MEHLLDLFQSIKEMKLLDSLEFHLRVMNQVLESFHVVKIAFKFYL